MGVDRRSVLASLGVLAAAGTSALSRIVSGSDTDDPRDSGEAAGGGDQPGKDGGGDGTTPGGDQGNGGQCEESGPSVLFQGQEDAKLEGVEFGDQLVGVENGGAENETLEFDGSIPQNQPRGEYKVEGEDDQYVSITDAVIHDISLLNGRKEVNGTEIGTDDAQKLSLEATYNFPQAADLTIEVKRKDEYGEWDDVTDEVTSGQQSKSPDGRNEVEWDISPDDEGEYLIELEGTEGLDFGKAEEEMSVTVDGQVNDVDNEMVENFTEEGLGI